MRMSPAPNSVTQEGMTAPCPTSLTMTLMSGMTSKTASPHALHVL